MAQWQFALILKEDYKRSRHDIGDEGGKGKADYAEVQDEALKEI